jgi:hypothetical protein
MSDQTSESSAKDILLTRLADEFAARYRAGQRPPLQEYIDRYPETITVWDLHRRKLLLALPCGCLRVRCQNYAAAPAHQPS